VSNHSSGSDDHSSGSDDHSSGSDDHSDRATARPRDRATARPRDRATARPRDRASSSPTMAHAHPAASGRRGRASSAARSDIRTITGTDRAEEGGYGPGTHRAGSRRRYTRLGVARARPKDAAGYQCRIPREVRPVPQRVRPCSAAPAPAPHNRLITRRPPRPDGGIGAGAVGLSAASAPRARDNPRLSRGLAPPARLASAHLAWNPTPTHRRRR